MSFNDWRMQQYLRDCEQEANNLESQGKLEDAEQLYKSIFYERLRSLGAEHVDTQSGLRSLTDLLKSQQRHEEANNLYAQAATGQYLDFSSSSSYQQWPENNWPRMGFRRRQEADPNVCRHFLQGKCYRGQKCNFLHPNFEERLEVPGAASASDGHSKEEKEDLESNRQLRSLLSLVFASFARALDVQGTHRQGLLVADLEKLNDGNAQKLKQQLGKKRKQALMALLDQDPELEFVQELQREAVLRRQRPVEALLEAENATELAKHLREKELLAVFFVGFSKEMVAAMEEILQGRPLESMIFASFSDSAMNGELIKCFEMKDLTICQTRNEIRYEGRQYRYHYLVLGPDASVLSLEGLRHLRLVSGGDFLSQLLGRHVADLAREKGREVLLVEQGVRVWPQVAPRWREATSLECRWRWQRREIKEAVQLNVLCLEPRIFQLPELLLKPSNHPVVLRKHLERLAGYLERLCRDPRSVLRSGAEGLVAALLLPRLQSFATEFLCGASLADHAAPEDVEAKALGFFTELQLEIRMEEVRTVLRSFLTKSQFHGTSVYRQNETFVTLSSGGPVLWTSVRQLFKEIGAEIQCEGNVKAAMGVCKEKALQVLELLGSGMASEQLWPSAAEQQLFQEGLASKPLRQLQVLRDVHVALRQPLDLAICITAARRIHVACSNFSSSMRLPSIRSGPPLDLTLGQSEEALDASEASLMCEFQLTSEPHALAALFRCRGNAAAAELCVRLAREAPWKAKEDEVMRQFDELRRCLEVPTERLQEAVKWLVNVKEEVRLKASQILEGLGEKENLWDAPLPKGVADFNVSPVCQAQILLDLHQVQDMDPQGWLTTARRILYLAGVAEAVEVPRLSDDQAKQYGDIMAGAEGLGEQLMYTMSAHALGSVCQEMPEVSDLVEGQRLRKEKHLEKAAGFFLRAMKEALPDDAARYYKCLYELVEIFRELQNEAAENFCCLLPLADSRIWDSEFRGD